MKIGEAYSLFVDENPNVTIGKSKFAELRPKEVLLSSKTSCNICGCIYHENMILLLQELHCIVPDMFPLYGKEFISSCVYEINNKKCMSSNCALCKNKFKSIFIDDVDDTILQKNSTWYQWERNEIDGQTEKVEKKGNLHQLLNMLETNLRKFLYHYFINKRQSETYNSCKVLATSESSDTVMVQTDFSKNFSYVYQDEMSSAHWKTNSVTLYTVMIWFREHEISTVLLSDSSIHDKMA